MSEEIIGSVKVVSKWTNDLIVGKIYDVYFNGSDNFIRDEDGDKRINIMRKFPAVPSSFVVVSNNLTIKANEHKTIGELIKKEMEREPEEHLGDGLFVTPSDLDAMNKM